jgi:hypothetical protein
VEEDTLMLTICIPTIPARRSLLSRLLFTLEHQSEVFAFDEVLVADGDWPLGDKVNTMFAAARGRYVIVVDDDDLLAVDYAAVVSEVLHDGPRFDMIGYHLLWTEQGRFMGLPLHHGDGHPDHGIEDRGASVKCPTRVEIARRHLMGNDYYADDRWARAVHPEIETHITIRRPMYHYDHWNDQMVGTDLHGEQASWYDRPQRDVGQWPYDPSLFTWIGSGT